MATPSHSITTMKHVVLDADDIIMMFCFKMSLCYDSDISIVTGEVGSEMFSGMVRAAVFSTYNSGVSSTPL